MATTASIPGAVARAADEFAGRLRARWGDRLVTLRLFGSFARGTAHEDSDVDLLVVIERVSWTERREVIDLATDVGLEHGFLLSPTVFERSEWQRWLRQERPLIMDATREGVAL